MENRQLVGLAGALVLFVGVFAPLVSVPIMGSMNYFQNGKGDGVVILVFAGISVLLCLTRRYKGLWLTGAGSIAVLLFTFVNFQNKLGGMKAQMDRDLAGNPFRGLADVAVQSVQLQWGWAVLIVGAVILMIAAAMKEVSLRSVECPHCGGVLPISQPSCNHCGNKVTWIQGKARRPSRTAE